MRLGRRCRPGWHRGALHTTDEPGGCLVALPGAVGDVARRDDDIPGRRSRGSLRSAANGEEAPRRATRTIGAYFLLLMLTAAPSRSEATTEPAATILTNFVEMAISLLVRGRQDTPRASPPRRTHLHTRYGLARCAVVRSLSVAGCQPGAPQSSVSTT